MSKNLESMGEEIRNQGQGTSMMDLVLNDITGDFEMVPHGSSLSQNGKNVTVMTVDGFAL